MTKEHTLAAATVADILAWTPSVEATSRKLLADAFAHAIGAGDPSFDRGLFMAAALKNDDPPAGGPSLTAA